MKIIPISLSLFSRCKFNHKITDNFCSCECYLTISSSKEQKGPWKLYNLFEDQQLKPHTDVTHEDINKNCNYTQEVCADHCNRTGKTISIVMFIVVHQGPVFFRSNNELLRGKTLATHLCDKELLSL